MLAARLPGLLPRMTEIEALESAAMQSLGAKGFQPCNWMRRPYRVPHHTASAVALVGGGANPRPGEISLAHNGVLFLDELPEFDRKVLEVLRGDMMRRSAQMVDDQRPEARGLIANNVAIMEHLTHCLHKAQDSTRILGKLGVDAYGRR